MTDGAAERSTMKRVVSYLFQRGAAVTAGCGAYFALRPFIVIEQQDQVAAAFFTIAGVVGVVAGFLGAAVFFVAAAEGPSIERLRREHGKSLNMALLGAMATLMAGTLASVVCGLFSNGFGAKAAMMGTLLLVAYEVVVLGLALAVALKSGQQRPTPRREGYDPEGDVSGSSAVG